MDRRLAASSTVKAGLPHPTLYRTAAPLHPQANDTGTAIEKERKREKTTEKKRERGGEREREKERKREGETERKRGRRETERDRDTSLLAKHLARRICESLHGKSNRGQNSKCTRPGLSCIIFEFLFIEQGGLFHSV